jgi:hypothetical protein
MKFSFALAFMGVAQALVVTPTSTNTGLKLRESTVNLMKKDSNAMKAFGMSDCPFKEETLEPQDGGSSYVGRVFVGYKNFQCLWDTGSFDLQMISSKCSNCENTTALYSHEQSPTHELLAMDKSIVEIEYGSGPATIQKGFDRVGLYDKDGVQGRCMAKHTPVGEILKTSIKELKGKDRRFEGVCGIAPGPKEKEEQRLIKKLGIDRVGFCFNEDPKKPGLARWNIDTSSHGFKYSTNPNMGYYWAIRVNEFRFKDGANREEAISCGKDAPCLGLMDTGTSLHSVDNTTLDFIYKKLNEIPNLSCEDEVLKKLPSLVYTDDSGNDLVISPADYLVQVDETKMRQKLGRTFDFHDIPVGIKKHLHFTPENMPGLLQKSEGKPQCVLALADSGEKGMHIFGMPFFRHNQVVLDIKQRQVSWGPHDGNCNAAKQSLLEKEGEAPKLKKIDPTELRLSSASNRMKEAKAKGTKFVNQVRRELGFLQL